MSVVFEDEDEHDIYSPPHTRPRSRTRPPSNNTSET